MALLVPEGSLAPEARAALPPWLRGLRRGLDRLSAVLLALAMLVLALVFVLMNIEIVTRSVFGVSTLISDEYGGYGFAFVVLAGLIYAHRNGSLLNVEFGAGLMGPRTRMVSLALASLASVFVAGFAAYVGYLTWSLSWRFGSVSAFASSTPLWLPQLVVPLGFAALALSFAEDFVSRAYLARKEG